MKTRQQRLNNECTHEEYYSQFITDGLIQAIKKYIGTQTIKNAIASGDNHLNTIPLQSWDTFINYNRSIVPLMKQCGDFLTMAASVCIAKTAARQLINIKK